MYQLNPEMARYAKHGPFLGNSAGQGFVISYNKTTNLLKD